MKGSVAAGQSNILEYLEISQFHDHTIHAINMIMYFIMSHLFSSFLNVSVSVSNTVHFYITDSEQFTHIYI